MGNDGSYELIRFDVNVIRRIISVLYDTGRINMTNLSTKANVQYGRLVKYIEWLIIIGAVQKIKEGKNNEFLITERGREILKIFYSIIIIVIFVELGMLSNYNIDNLHNIN